MPQNFMKGQTHEQTKLVYPEQCKYNPRIVQFAS